MARIIGGIGTSHVPTIGMAFDKGKQNDPDWKPLFDGYAGGEMAGGEEARRAVLLLQRPRHDVLRSLSTFALGVSDEYRIADEGLGARPIPRLKGGTKLRARRQLAGEREFDLTIFQDLPLQATVCIRRSP